MDSEKEEIGLPVKINKDGRIMIPEPVRKSLGLKWRDDAYVKIRKMEPGEVE